MAGLYRAGNSQAIIYSKESDEIIHKLSLKIYEAEYRILIVWLPEKLHPTCANKLLKIIEEPPMRTVILMVSETPDLILGTIQSRAQHIHIRPIETDAIMNAMVSRFGFRPTTLNTSLTSPPEVLSRRWRRLAWARKINSFWSNSRP